MAEPQAESMRLVNRAELYHCLGRAFMPPVERGSREAIARALAADLEELLPGRGAGAELAAAMVEVPDQQALLRGYSRLFLVPPYAVPLNAGLYIDGTVMGPSVLEMERFYQRHGLSRDPGFRDTPDHLALQLQFLAMLFGAAARAEDEPQALHALQEARNFLNRFLRPWPNDLVRRLERECGRDPRARPYAILGSLVRDALDDDARWLQTRVPAQTPDPVAPEMASAVVTPVSTVESGEQVHCGHCGKPFAPSEHLAGIVRILEERGLDAGHLSVCPDCRAEVMGLHPTRPDFKEVKGA